MSKLTQQYSSLNAVMQALPDKLTSIPWKAICRHYENKYKHAGDKVFQFAAPQILSPFAPQIKQRGDEKRITINILIAANPGGGKTALMKEIKKITPGNGDKVKMMQEQTDKGVQDLIRASPGGIELLVNDMKTIMGDPDLLKVYETVIADGFISRLTNNDDIDDDEVQAAMVSGCVPSDISKQISGGMLQRIVPIYLKYSAEEQKEVMNHIAGQVGTRNKSTITTNDIATFYDALYYGIKGRFDKNKPVTGYHFTDKQSQFIVKKAQQAIDSLPHLTDEMNMTRQLWDGYRFTALIALLNMHNRERQTENGYNDIVINERDVQVGSSLMQVELGQLNGMINMFEGIKKDMKQIQKYTPSKYGTDHLKQI